MEKNHKENSEPRKKATNFVVGGLAGLSILYLLCPSILPDVIPVIGALDEAAATTLLISCFAYFGFDVSKLVQLLLSLFRGEAKPTRVNEKAPPAGTIDVETL